MVEYFRRDYPEFYSIDAVVIESQQVAKPIMQCLASAIQSHFLTLRECGVCKPELTVDISSGDAKLRVYDGEVTWTPPKGPLYQRNKRTGVEHCRALLAQRRECSDTPDEYKAWTRLIEFYEAAPKHDDLADALLQALAFALTNKHQVKRADKRGFVQPVKPPSKRVLMIQIED